MGFTESDSIKEIILKVMIAEAAASSGRVSEEDRMIILEWMRNLQIEGPEEERIKSLLTEEFDSIQISIFLNQLHAALSDRSKKEGIKKLMDGILRDRKHIYTLENNLQNKIQLMINDESLIERLQRSGGFL